MKEVLDLTRRELAPAPGYYKEDFGGLVEFDEGAVKIMFSRMAELHTEVLRRQNEVKQDFIIIGAILAEIEHDGLYHVVQTSPNFGWGYSNFYKFCEAVYGFKQTTTKNLLGVYRTFCNEQGLIKIEYSNYSYSQLVELLPIERGWYPRITAMCSSRQIRKLKTLYKEYVPKQGTTWEDDLKEWERRHKEKQAELNEKKNSIQFVPAFSGRKDDGQAPDHQEDDQEIVTPTVGKKVRTADVIKGLFAQLELLKQSDEGEKWELFADGVAVCLANDEFVPISLMRSKIADFEKAWAEQSKEMELKDQAIEQQKSQIRLLTWDLDGYKQQFEQMKKVDVSTLSFLQLSNEGHTPGKLDLKNKKAREEWLKNYEAWGVWIEVPDLQMKYYRCNFVNGASLIVSVGFRYDWDYSKGRIADEPYEVVRYAVFDEQYKVYDTWGISFTQTVEWLTKYGKEI